MRPTKEMAIIVVSSEHFPKHQSRLGNAHTFVTSNGAAVWASSPPVKVNRKALLRLAAGPSPADYSASTLSQ